MAGASGRVRSGLRRRLPGSCARALAERGADQALQHEIQRRPAIGRATRPPLPGVANGQPGRGAAVGHHGLLDDDQGPGSGPVAVRRRARRTIAPNRRASCGDRAREDLHRACVFGVSQVQCARFARSGAAPLGRTERAITFGSGDSHQRPAGAGRREPGGGPGSSRTMKSEDPVLDRGDVLGEQARQGRSRLCATDSRIGPREGRSDGRAKSPAGAAGSAAAWRDPAFRGVAVRSPGRDLSSGAVSPGGRRASILLSLALAAGDARRHPPRSAGPRTRAPGTLSLDRPGGDPGHGDDSPFVPSRRAAGGDPGLRSCAHLAHPGHRKLRGDSWAAPRLLGCRDPSPLRRVRARGRPHRRRRVRADALVPAQVRIELAWQAQRLAGPVQAGTPAPQYRGTKRSFVAQASSPAPNGVTPRRWLLESDSEPAGLITETIGDGWVRDLAELRKLEPCAEDLYRMTAGRLPSSAGPSFDAPRRPATRLAPRSPAPHATSVSVPARAGTQAPPPPRRRHRHPR
ncbi:MAG: glycogen/starch/alpha-glucan phosphorylase, partial [Planctomycetes bacterium]|nr:glycogen/starch/alpha-glucan phosphorylase [Planctomycetota bacterium]